MTRKFLNLQGKKLKRKERKRNKLKARKERKRRFSGTGPVAGFPPVGAPLVSPASPEPNACAPPGAFPPAPPAHFYLSRTNKIYMPKAGEKT